MIESNPKMPMRTRECDDGHRVLCDGILPFYVTLDLGKTQARSRMSNLAGRTAPGRDEERGEQSCEAERLEKNSLNHKNSR